MESDKREKSPIKVRGVDKMTIELIWLAVETVLLIGALVWLAITLHTIEKQARTLNELIRDMGSIGLEIAIMNERLSKLERESRRI